jgi:hypothetical protein
MCERRKEEMKTRESERGRERERESEGERKRYLHRRTREETEKREFLQKSEEIKNEIVSESEKRCKFAFFLLQSPSVLMASVISLLRDASPAFICPTRCGLPAAVATIGMEGHCSANEVPQHRCQLVTLPDVIAHREAISKAGGLRRFADRLSHSKSKS